MDARVKNRNEFFGRLRVNRPRRSQDVGNAGDESFLCSCGLLDEKRRGLLDQKRRELITILSGSLRECVIYSHRITRVNKIYCHMIVIVFNPMRARTRSAHGQ